MYPKLLSLVTIGEAQTCIPSLMIGAAEAMNQVHSIGYARGNVCLENICFDPVDLVPILIDLDNCQTVDQSTSLLDSKTSCMYDTFNMFYSADKKCGWLDWFQLGWIAIWILWGCDTGNDMIV